MSNFDKIAGSSTIDIDDGFIDIEKTISPNFSSDFMGDSEIVGALFLPGEYSDYYEYDFQRDFTYNVLYNEYEGYGDYGYIMDYLFR